ncbi:MAG: alpha-1,2-mannosyltransferase [Parasphingorhabdus sp.]|jgi:alpha-1,2-mannosyltransferase
MLFYRNRNQKSLIKERNPDLLEMLAWSIWLLFLLYLVLNRLDNGHGEAEVFKIYLDAANRWLDAKPLYNGNGTDFIYFPQAAIFFIPFTYIEPEYSGILWRILNTGIYALGVYRLSQVARQYSRLDQFLLISVVSILMGASAAKLGQLTLLVTGLMMLTVYALHYQRTAQAAWLIMLGLFLKPLALPFALLVMVFYPTTAKSILLAVVVFLLIPFLTQSAEYVVQEVENGFTTMRYVAEFGRYNPTGHAFAQLFWMLDFMGLSIPIFWQIPITLLLAMATLYVCHWIRMQADENVFLICILTLAACFILLFNPRTEGNTYVLMAPPLAVFLGWCWIKHTNYLRYVLVVVLLGFLSSHSIGHWLIDGPTVWIKPLLCIFFLASVFAFYRRTVINNI